MTRIPAGSNIQSGGLVWAVLLWGLFLLVGRGSQAAEPGLEAVDYQLQVQPLLAKYCTSCHGPTKQESGLRLDAAALVLRGGESGPAVVPGESAESLLIQAITDSGLVTRMPPDDQPGLTAEETAVLKSWIDQGAPAPDEGAIAPIRSDHWSFQAPLRPELPTVGNRDWPRNPIDTFILARLEREGLAPSPPADRATLIRRLSLDLLGLPPSVDEVRAFVADPDEQAYQRLVDRLLASPAYGERWGRHWLDLARYADSNGYTRDFGRGADRPTGPAASCRPRIRVCRCAAKVPRS